MTGICCAFVMTICFSDVLVTFCWDKPRTYAQQLESQIVTTTRTSLSVCSISQPSLWSYTNRICAPSMLSSTQQQTPKKNTKEHKARSLHSNMHTRKLMSAERNFRQCRVRKIHASAEQYLWTSLAKDWVMDLLWVKKREKFTLLFQWIHCDTCLVNQSKQNEQAKKHKKTKTKNKANWNLMMVKKQKPQKWTTKRNSSGKKISWLFGVLPVHIGSPLQCPLLWQVIVPPPL